MANNKKNEAITARDVDFAKWYTDVCRKAELMDYSGVKGFIIYRPYGYALWEQIQNHMDKKFKELCIEEKCIVLYEILHFFQCQSAAADLKLIGGSGRAGILCLNKNITDCSRIEMIHQSPTGIYEQAVDLNAL